MTVHARRGTRSVDEAGRLLLHDAARTAFGADAALVLMEMLPPTGWGEVATRQQLEAVDIATRQRLEAMEQRLDTRIDILEERSGTRIDHGLDRLRPEMAVGRRHVLQWLIATMIAMTGVFAALTRLG